MRNGQVKFLLFFAFSLLFVISAPSFAQTPTPSPSSAPATDTSFFNTNFFQNVTVAVLSAFLAFLSGYALAGIGRKQGNAKRLSYSISLEKGLVTIEKNVRQRVKVFYAGEEIENLYHIKCDIENTGITVIKSQEIRFEFTPETRILDPSFEPTPEPEMKVEEINDPALKPYEKKYRIGHIERNQSVGFRFTATSSKEIQLVLHPFNESGDVEFLSRAVSKVTDEKEKITRFLTLLIMYFIIPEVIYFIGNHFLSTVIAALIRLVILIFLFPLIVPFAKAVSNVISALSFAREETPRSKYTVSVEAVETGGNVTVGDIYNNQ